MDTPEACARNLRKGRCYQPGRPYLITTCTYRRRHLFREIVPARIVVQAIRDAHRRGLASTLAFVLMPDHLHWLLVPRRNTLDVVMRRFKGYSGVAVNRALGFGGRVWQAGYHDHGIRSDADLRQVARYVVSNPLRAGLAETVGDYPHWYAIWMEEGD